MRFPQILVYEHDGRVAGLLREPVRAQKWVLREPRSRAALAAQLASSGPTAVVVRTGRELVGDFELVENMGSAFPQVPVIVVLETENPELVDLAWHLGAIYVFAPPWHPADLIDVVISLVRTATEAPP